MSYPLTHSLINYRGRQVSTGGMRLKWHVVAPSPHNKDGKNRNANNENELALAA